MISKWLVFFGLLLVVADCVTAAGNIRLVASENETFPQLLHAPSIDGRGLAAFFAFTPVVGAPTERTIWQESATGLQAVIQTGQTASGVPAGSLIQSPTSTVITNEVGQLISRAGFNDDRSAHVLADGLTRRAIGATRTPTPGLPGMEFSGLRNVASSLNDLGETAFIASLRQVGTVTTTGSSVWSEAGGTGLRLIGKDGDVLPGLGPGETLRVFSRQPHVVLDDSGRTGFFSQVGLPTGGSSGILLWIDDATTGPRIVARDNTTIDGLSLQGLSNLALNNRGEAGFIAQGSTDEENRRRVIIEDETGLFRTVAETTGNVPGGPPLSTFLDFRTRGDWLNDRGEALIWGRYTRGDLLGLDAGLWLGVPSGELELVMRKGQQTPPTAAEGTLLFDQPQDWQLNDAGEIAFTSNLLEPGQIQSSRQSIWIRSASGDFQRIIADGDQLPIEIDGVVQQRAVQSVRLASGGTLGEMPRFFNDAGQLAFLANLEGGASGIYVYSPVPEPAGVMLIALLCCPAFSQRSKRAVGTACG